MSIKIDYKSGVSKKPSSNLVLFTNEKFNISNLKKHVSSSEFSYINDLLKTSDLKKDLLVFDVSSKKKIVLISIKNNLKIFEIENLGAKFYVQVNYGKNCEYFINTDSISSKQKNLIGYFLHGLKLKSYQFLKYKTKKDTREILLKIFGKNLPSLQDQLRFKSIEDGTFYARDLVSEPGNILHPDEYAKRVRTLKKLGL